MKPTYQHDCDGCEFIEPIVVEGIVYDVYRCTGSPSSAIGPTWLARYDDPPGCYWSMPWGVLKTAEGGTELLREVRALARSRECNKEA